MDEGKRKRVRVYLLIGLVFILATNIGYLALLMRTPKGSHYTGMGLEANGDKLVYYSMIQQGMQGRLFMVNSQTSEPQRGLLFSPHWLLIGETARVLHIPFEASYHFYRIVLTALFLWILYLFVRKLPFSDLFRFVAYSAVLFGSGLGLLYIKFVPYDQGPLVHWMSTFQSIPADIYVTEMNTFLTFLQSPLFMLSYILLFGIMYVFVGGDASYKHWRALVIFGLTLLLIMIHPYDAVILMIVMGSWTVWKIAVSRQWGSLMTYGVMTCGVALSYLYAWWAFRSEPALQGWIQQNITYSPRFSMYAWSFGIFFIPWCMGIYHMMKVREKNPWLVLMGIWSVFGWVLIYLPLLINRRLSNAWFIPIVVVSCYAIFVYHTRIRSFTMKVMLSAIFISLALASTTWRIITYVTYVPPLVEKYSYYLDSYAGQLMAVGGALLTERDVVLSNESFISMLVSAYTPIRVYLGHEHQTANFLLKKQQVDWFFNSLYDESTLARKEAFIRSAGITQLVVYKPSIRTDISWLESALFLKKVFSNDMADMYTVL